METFSPDLVSIVMPAYNAGRYLGSAIESVLAQTWPHWELLVVNDASKDDTAEIALRYQQQDTRIRVLQQPVNQGVAAARNRALAEARGEFIAFLDSDDLWLPEKLSLQLDFLRKHNARVVYSGYIRMDENGTETGTVVPPSRIDYRGLLKGNVIGNLTGMYSAAALGKQQFGKFRHEDYVAWLALVRRAGEARGLPQPLGRYRVYAGSTSGNKLRTIGWQWRIYRDSEGLSLPRSGALMLHYACHALAKRF